MNYSSVFTRQTSGHFNDFVRYSLVFAIFAAQNVITYHWKGNRINNVLSTITDHYSDDLNIPNG